MNYLFGFGGRINRAKMWLFILVTLAWEIVIGIVGAIGLKWSELYNFNRVYAHTTAEEGTNLSINLHFLRPGPIDTPKEMVAAGIIAILVLLYVVALFAVYTKRLHDRNKSAWWLIPFLVIPWGLAVLKWTVGPGWFYMGPYFGPLGVGWGAAHLIGTILGLWAFIELFFFRGTYGANRYGPDPLAKG